MSSRDKKTLGTPLSQKLVTAHMSSWMPVKAFSEECLFGFAEAHPRTGGLSWVLSTPVIELSEAADRARTASGRVYTLGHRILARELDQEGYVALRLLLSGSEDYPGRDDDAVWVTTQKMARHLGVGAPLRTDTIAVERFLERYLLAYQKLSIGYQ